MGDLRTEKVKSKTTVIDEEEEQNKVATTFLNGGVKSESLRSLPEPRVKTGSTAEKSERRYKVISLVFAVLCLLWFVLLVLVATIPVPPREAPCESQETPRALSLCLPCVTLPPQLRSSSCLRDLQENPAAELVCQSFSSVTSDLHHRYECCAKNNDQWKDFVTAFANVEFAKRKRGMEEKVLSTTDNQGHLTRRKRADDKYNVLEELKIDHSGIHFVSADLTLRFIKRNNTMPPLTVSCIIRHMSQGKDDNVVPVSVSACSVEEGKICLMPVNFGRLISLEENDTLSLEIEKHAHDMEVTLHFIKAEKIG